MLNRSATVREGMPMSVAATNFRSSRLLKLSIHAIRGATHIGWFRAEPDGDQNILADEEGDESLANERWD